MLSKEKLCDIEARCKNATPGPWANTDNVQEIFGHMAYDWWKVYAPKKEDSVLPSMVICSMSSRATEEEMVQARKISWADESKTYDPGEAALDARFIAHARTDIPELLTHIREQEAELAHVRRALNIVSQTMAERCHFNNGVPCEFETCPIGHGEGNCVRASMDDWNKKALNATKDTP